jgi:hypothetical protein
MAPGWLAGWLIHALAAHYTHYTQYFSVTPPDRSVPMITVNISSRRELVAARGVVQGSRPRRLDACYAPLPIISEL